MRTPAFFILIMIAFGQATLAQSKLYDVSRIPDSIKRNASSVTRAEEIDFDVTAPDEAFLNVHRVVTIMDDRGRGATAFCEREDKFIHLEDAEAITYDASGQQLMKIGKAGLHSTSVGGEIMSDAKIYYVPIINTAYPVTIEYNYRMRYSGIITYPMYLILAPDAGVESSTFSARAPRKLGLRSKAVNIILPCDTSEFGDTKIYIWRVNNRVPRKVEEEESQMNYQEKYPSIIFAPNRFKLDGYEGDMTSWKNFGKWFSSVQGKKDKFSEGKRQFYEELLGKGTSDVEKMKIAYSYLQNNFRYVAIELGIGGFKSYPVDFTDSKKYGDCKSLCKYMQAVLATVGIKSYLALVNGGNRADPVDALFPSEQFNHVILCVPQAKDTIWLECTGKFNEFGVLGPFTENKHALLITDDGGVLVHTPQSKSSDNKLATTTLLHFDEKGFGISNTIIKGTGYFREELLSFLDKSMDGERKYAITNWGIENPDSISRIESKDDEIAGIFIQGKKHPMAELRTSNRLFISGRICNIWTSKLPASATRTNPYAFKTAFERVDTTIIEMPDNFKVEVLPEEKKLDCGYASYSSIYWITSDKKNIFIATKLILNRTVVPPADYGILTKFFEDINRDYLQKIIIVKD